MNFTNNVCIILQAACHKDRSISKRAIEYIQDVITSLLVEQTELPHFHFNEALLKPFENLLSMETCDIDVQVSIVRTAKIRITLHVMKFLVETKIESKTSHLNVT